MDRIRRRQIAPVHFYILRNSAFPSVLPKMVNAEVISREENKHRFQDIVGCQTVKFELILFIDFFRDPQLSI
jgi:ATP-dependent Zn protease